MRLSSSCYIGTMATSRGGSEGGRRGIFAGHRIAAGDVVAAWGGDVVDRCWLDAAGPVARRLALQIDRDLFLVSPGTGAAQWVNHSCEPNAGIRGQVLLVAMLDIAVGEEICLDYAMVGVSSRDEFDCTCGTGSCRRRITAADWRLARLRLRYAGYFSEYWQRRIQDEHRAVSARAPLPA